MDAERCQGRTASGQSCNAKALPGERFCPWHSPQWRERRREWSAKGGAARSNASRAARLLVGSGSRQEVAARLLAVMERVERGELGHGPANAIANLARAWATVVADSDLAAEIASVRAELATLKRERPA